MTQALLIQKVDDQYSCAVTEMPQLPAMEASQVRVQVSHSTINFKDGLAITGRSPVVRKFPMVPGIDFVGTVIESLHPKWQPGDAVILNGFGVGEGHWGGLAPLAQVSGDWLLALPQTISPQRAMAIGTAGYTAALCVLALLDHGVKAGDEVLVTGASGGVGSVATALLAQHGIRVVASTGKLAEAAYLQNLGAAEVIDRAAFSDPGKPLQKERWAGVVDSVGSHTLVNACASTRYGGIVAACGLAQGMDLPGSVAPFILRGVTLAGIDSVMAPMAKRERAWAMLAQDLSPDLLDSMTQVVGLSGALEVAPRILAGQVKGRVVVDVNQA
ncbi:MAG: hypothetical protein RL357_338 [Pseudomonadota bacterium]